MPSQYLLENNRVDVCVTSAKTVAPPYGPLEAQPLGLYGRCPWSGALGTLPLGRMRKNAALGRIKHPHYALFVKVVSSAFSRGGVKVAIDLRSGCRLRPDRRRASGLFWKRACVNELSWAMWLWATAKKDGLRNIREEPKPGPATAVGQFCCPFRAGVWPSLPRIEGQVKERDKSLVQKFTFALTPQVGLGNCDFSQVRALYW